jgi:hypothetical protein
VSPPADWGMRAATRCGSPSAATRNHPQGSAPDPIRRHPDAGPFPSSAGDPPRRMWCTTGADGRPSSSRPHTAVGASTPLDWPVCPESPSACSHSHPGRTTKSLSPSSHPVLVGHLLLSFSVPAFARGSADSRLLPAVDFFTWRKRQVDRMGVDADAVHRWFGELGLANLRMPSRDRFAWMPSVLVIRPLMIGMTERCRGGLCAANHGARRFG